MCFHAFEDTCTQGSACLSVCILIVYFFSMVGETIHFVKYIQFISWNFKATPLCAVMFWLHLSSLWINMIHLDICFSWFTAIGDSENAQITDRTMNDCIQTKRPYICDNHVYLCSVFDAYLRIWRLKWKQCCAFNQIICLHEIEDASNRIIVYWYAGRY